MVMDELGGLEEDPEYGAKWIALEIEGEVYIFCRDCWFRVDKCICDIE